MRDAMMQNSTITSLGLSLSRGKISTDIMQQIKALHAKIGELTVEKDFLQEVSTKFALGGGRKW